MKIEIRKIYQRVKTYLSNMTMRRAVILTLRIVLGLFFIYSSFGMVIDPEGVNVRAERVLEESNLTILLPLSHIFSFVVSALKFMIGVCLFIGANIVYSALYFIIFLIFEIILFSVSSETHSQDITRDVIFILFGILFIWWRKSSVKIYTKRTEWIISIYSFLYAILLSGHCYYSLPIIDKTEAKEGRLFSEVLMNESVKFQVPLSEASEVCGHIAEEGYTFVLLSRNITNATTVSRKKINALYEYAEAHHYPFFCVTRKETEPIVLQEYIIENSGAEYDFYFLDKQILDDVARSNPQLIILNDGVIVKKFSAYKIPEFSDEIGENPYPEAREKASLYTVLRCIFIFLLPLLIVLAYDYLVELLKFLYNKFLKPKKQETAS